MKENVIFFIFFALIKIWLQHQINSIILGIIPTFYVWIRPIQENKKFTSSDCHHCFLTFFRFSSYFRLPDMIETYPKPQFGPLPTTCKKVWVSSLNRLAVRGRPDLDPRKKSRHYNWTDCSRQRCYYTINLDKGSQFLIPYLQQIIQFWISGKT